jgi:DNA-directed RNA polymerase subunit M/transcription elongation factor TFIIS
MTECNKCHENREPISDFQYGAFDMTLEKDFKCKLCGRKWTEIWVHSTDIDLPE